MVERAVFASIKKDFDVFEKSRELLIRLSRDVLKDSKAAIYELHRGKAAKAGKLLSDCRKTVAKISSLASKDPVLANIGAIGEALEEYVEASCYAAFCSRGNIPSHKSLGVSIHVYLPGVCDLVGELVRKAMNDVIKGDYDSAMKIKGFVEELYAELMLFDWRNTPVRRKFDSIKYQLEKLQELVVQLMLKR